VEEGGEEKYYVFEGGEKGDLSSFFMYAGTPSGIPRNLLETHFGVLNKQLAFAQWDSTDVDNIEEEIQIERLKTLIKCRRYELKGFNAEIYRQMAIIAKGLASLGKEGFLLKQATTSVKEIRETREGKKGGFLFFRR